MRRLVNSASRGLVTLVLAAPLLVGGCDPSKPELVATKAKLDACSTERDGHKARLDATLAGLANVTKERDEALAKLAAAEAAAAKPPEVAVAEPVAPAPAPKIAAPAPAKKPTGAKSGALSTALLDRGPAVQQCAIEHALDKGAKKATVSVRVTIDQSGAVVDTQVTANVTDGDGSKVKACVENVVRSAKFPAIPTRMATDERSWTIAAE